VGKLTLYGKPGCHLCHDAREAVRRVLLKRAVALEEVDVTLDPVLFARYGERIPVLELDGEVLFEFVVDEDLLQQRLDRVTT
jgi:glutaredoxin